DYVRSLCSPRFYGGTPLSRAPKTIVERSARKGATSSIEKNGLHPRRAIQSRCIWWWLYRAVDAGIVASSALRFVDSGRRRCVFLDGSADGRFVSHCCADCRSIRTDQYDGFHAPSLERLFDPAAACAGLGLRDCAALREECSLADGCADTKLLCHGNRHTGGTARRGRHHLGAAQPGCRDQSISFRIPARRVDVWLAPHPRRRTEDRVRHSASRKVPEDSATRGKRLAGRICTMLVPRVTSCLQHPIQYGLWRRIEVEGRSTCSEVSMNKIPLYIRI